VQLFLEDHKGPLRVCNSWWWRRDRSHRILQCIRVPICLQNHPWEWNVRWIAVIAQSKTSIGLGDQIESKSHWIVKI
jgi:hypothetical protein